MESKREENEHEISKSSKLSCCRRIVPSDIYIHLDLQVEILKKLPAKSLLKFRCVSKQWSTIIRSRYFIDSIIARPLVGPPKDNLHFIFHHYRSPKPFFVFSSTYTDKEEEAILIPLKCQYDLNMYQYVRGLILCSSIYTSLITIYNPTTRQFIYLPEPGIEFRSNKKHCFFGYEPIMNQYKVMCVINGNDESEHACKVFTLGDPMKQWRTIQSIGNHSTIGPSVHINGVIYYGASYNKEFTVMSFDFSSERFYHINAPIAVTDIYRNPTFVNYKGKLGCLCTKLGVEMWIMEDAEKQTWSKTIYDLPYNMFYDLIPCYTFSGVTLGGEIFTIQSRYDHDHDPLYVYYYDPKQNSFRKNEINGTTERSEKMIIVGVSDHVENIMSLHHMT